MEANENVATENAKTENATVKAITAFDRMNTVSEDIQAVSKGLNETNKLLAWASQFGVKNITENLNNPDMVAGVAFNIDGLDDMLDRKQGELRAYIKTLKAARENLGMVKLEQPKI